MNRVLIAGLVCTGVGLTAYGMGVISPYPGRAFSLTLFMIGVALIAMRRVTEDPTPPEVGE